MTLQAQDLVSNSVIFFDARHIHERQIRAMFKACQESRPDITNITAIPVRGDADKALAMVTEEQMNKAGWYRK